MMVIIVKSPTNHNIDLVLFELIDIRLKEEYDWRVPKEHRVIIKAVAEVMFKYNLKSMFISLPVREDDFCTHYSLRLYA